MCDSQNKDVAVLENLISGEGSDISSLIDPLATQLPSDLEKKHVYDVYEKIAPHFSNTRYKPWPKVQAYLESLPPGSLNLDVGCGNGKYLDINHQSILTVGTD